MGFWEKEFIETGDKRDYILSRREWLITCILLVRMLSLQNVGILITEA